MELDEKQIERYSRNIVLAEIGVEGQRKLRAAGVLIVGAGGLGSPASLYLAAAGVGCLGIVDPDLVDLSNLQRQVLHATPGVGTSKAESAAARLRDLNPDVEIECRAERLTADNALELIERYDFVVDGTDNFAAKYLINDACVLAGKPYSHAGVLGFGGQVFTWEPPAGKHPCLRCLVPEPPSPSETPDCARSGVLGPAVGIVGSIQAAEAIKSICGTGGGLTGRLLSIDALRMRFPTVVTAAAPDCPVCSTTAEICSLDDSVYLDQP
ncbi:MAG: HesA/MoeB/ThiF family protein [Candidatus Glassbacteria bacterium]|nr:HesA/MoeB/ThiF family protein [Candidatus Glassbacteria bacterium]